MKTSSLILALALGAFAAAASAQPAAYPNKPIRLVIGFAPGGAADSVARAMSDAFGKALGQPVVVDNKPGNGSSIAAELVAKAPPGRLHAADREPEQHLGQPCAQSQAWRTRRRTCCRSRR